MSEHKEFDIFIENNKPVIVTIGMSMMTGERHYQHRVSTRNNHHILTVDRLREIVEQGREF